MEVRSATPADYAAIRNVHRHAFPTAAEADLVERLQRDGDAVVSLVADDSGIIGHVLLSRMAVEADGRPLSALGVGPVAVIPARQGEGIGSALMEAGVRDARCAGAQILFLLGEPAYYRRFGFDLGVARQFASSYAGPYFQALPLTDLPPVRSGVAHYAPAFSDLG